MIPITKVSGGELGMHMVSNGIESVRNAIAYDSRLRSTDWGQYSDWYSQAVASFTNAVTEDMVYETQQLLLAESGIQGEDWIYPIDDIKKA